MNSINHALLQCMYTLTYACTMVDERLFDGGPSASGPTHAQSMDAYIDLRVHLTLFPKDTAVLIMHTRSPMHASVHTHAHTQARARTHTHTHTHSQTHTQTHIRACTQVQAWTHTRMHTRTHARMRTRTRSCTNTHVCMCAHMPSHVILALAKAHVCTYAESCTYAFNLLHAAESASS